MYSIRKIIGGDCEEELARMTETVQLTVTSPPYYNAREYSHWDSYEEYMEWLLRIFRYVYDVTDDGRMCCVNVSPVIEPRESRSKESRRYPIPFDFVKGMCDIGWKFIDDIIWEKPEGAAPNRNGGFNRMRKPMMYKPNVVTEYILVFQKPMDGLIDKILREQSEDIMRLSLVDGDYDRSNVWKMNPERNREHPAPYPVELPERLIRYYSFVGDTVLDPFLGSGTTAVAAKNLGRGYIGIEYDDNYIKLAADRVKKVHTADEAVAVVYRTTKFGSEKGAYYNEVIKDIITVGPDTESGYEQLVLMADGKVARFVDRTFVPCGTEINCHDNFDEFTAICALYGKTCKYKISINEREQQWVNQGMRVEAGSPILHLTDEPIHDDWNPAHLASIDEIIAVADQLRGFYTRERS